MSHIDTATTSGGGTGNVEDINGQAQASQSIVAAATGTDFTVASAAGTHTIALPKADATHTGKLDKNDWTTFNGKLTKNVAIVGATKTKITYDANGLVTAGADIDAGDIPNLAASKINSGQGTLSTTTTGVTVGTGTNALLSNSTIDIQDATAAQPGLLTAANFTTFAAKEDGTNKDNTATLGTSATKFPTQLAVKTYVDFNSNPGLYTLQFDDFRQGGYSAARGYVESGYQWSTYINSTGLPVMPSTTMLSEVNHPGICELTTGAGTAGAAAVFAGNYGGSWNLAVVPGGGVITFETCFNLPALSSAADGFRIKLGLGRTPSNAGDTNNAVVDYYHTTSANWRRVTTKASSATSTTSATAVATGWHKIKIVINADATNVEFFYDDVSIGSNNTNIPLLGLSPLFSIDKLGGTTGTTPCLVGIDYIKVTQAFTTAR
jgi:hypothetical protein